MKKQFIYFLVYQAGIANVFKAEKVKRKYINHARILQSDFRTCENFCLGIRETGGLVEPAWLNEAGDISQSNWRFSNFDDAPFNDNFSPSFVKKIN